METIEEKAKAYDEAIERAKAYHRNELTGSKKEMIEYIFPQLAESEDEKIRKKLVQFLTDVKNISEGSRNSWAVRKEDAKMCSIFLDYLERQKEQKPISFNEPYNPDEYEVVMEGNATSLKRKEQKPVKLNEEDEELRYYVYEAVQARYSDRELSKYLDPKIIGEKMELRRKIFAFLRNLRPSLKSNEKDKEMKLKILKYLSTRCSVEQFEEVEEWLNDKLK